MLIIMVISYVIYVGQKTAKIIYENNWTLEDYVLHYGLSSSTTLQKSNRK